MDDDVRDPFDDDGDGVIELSDEEMDKAFEVMLQDASGQIPLPMLSAMAFLLHAWGEPPKHAPRFEELVTPESLSHWDLEEVREKLHGHALASNVRYLNPTWALVLLPRVEDSARPHILTRATPVVALGLYIRFDDADASWRVHLLGAPNIAVKELP